MPLQGHETPVTPAYAEGMSSGRPSRIAAVLATSGLRSRIAAVLATGVTEPPAPRPRQLRRGRADLVFLADTAAALILFAITINVLTNENARHSGSQNAGLIALASFVLCVPLVLRTRYPLTAWTVATLAMLFVSRTITPYAASPGEYVIPGVIVYVLCLYAVALRCKAWVVVTAGVVWRSSSAATGASGRCSRSASVSPVSCMTSSPTTCR